MANTKITELTQLTNPVSTDVLPIVDVAADVTKKISIADLLKNAFAGTAAAPGIAFDGDSNTGLFSPGPDQLGIATGGIQRLIIDSSGNITSIGASTATAFIPTGSSVPANGVYLPSANTVALATSSTGRVFIGGSGNVGIGVANPSEALEVSGNITFAPNPGAVRFVGCPNGSNTTLLLQGGSPTGEGANIELGRDEAVNIDASQHLFRSRDGLSERMRLDSIGRLGLGIDSPTANLHVYDTSGIVTARVQSGSNFGDFTHNGTDLFVSNTTGSTVFFFGVNERARITTDGKLGLGTSLPDEKCHIQDSTIKGTIKLGKDYYGILQQDSNNLNIIANGDQEYRVGLGTNNGSGSILFKTADGATGNTTRMAITSTGNVGINTASPSESLEVAGNIALSANTGSFRTIGFANSSNTTLLLQGGAASGTGGNIELGSNESIVYDGNTHIFRNVSGVSEFARIDDSGKLLIGSSTSASAGQAQYAHLQVEGNAFSVGQGIVAIRRATSSSGLTADTPIGQIEFTDNAGEPYARIEAVADGSTGTGDYPSRLVFSVTADGSASPTEALRISNDRAITVSDGGNVVLGTTTGTKIGTATSQKIGFYNTTPVVQPTTGVAEAAFVENSGGTAVNVDSTFGGYTIQQVVQALQSLGLLA